MPARELGINASIALPVIEVTSSELDGSYGVGSEITINVRQDQTKNKFSTTISSQRIETPPTNLETR